jgi:hypothetical protein
MVVVGVEQPSAAHASQQLESALAQPPRAAQAAALRTTPQRDPPEPWRQHATNPGRPQVERAAQRTTSLIHPGDRSPDVRCARAILFAQLM